MCVKLALGSRHERVHRCVDCGYETDRDLAAAEVILAWLHRDLAGQELAEAA